MHTGREQRRLISGSRVTAFGTLASRVLGMFRDAVTAAVFGLSGGGVMDAFVLAFRIPNLVRRLFGEGALAASYLPVLSATLERDRDEAWRLVSVLLLRLAVLLITLVILGEIALGILGVTADGSPDLQLVISLAAIMLPYTIFICLTAQAAATLQALGHFAVPALTPTILNLFWLLAILLVAPWISTDKVTQSHILAAAIFAAGVFQLGIQIGALRRVGFRFDYDPTAVQDAFRRVMQAMGPMVLGLMVTQINTLSDSVIAWLLAAPDSANTAIDWLGGVSYPMEQGAVAALYYGERLYQFPLGILGIAVATAIFPSLSRHAARNDFKSLSEDLTLGLRLVLFLGIPAAVGLVLLAEPLARLLYERREFTPEDTARTARVIACYAVGVWAYCALPVLVRGYYALGDRLTPVRIGISIVAVNFGLNLVLIWPFAESGLAVATTVGATLQVIVLTIVFSRRHAPLHWSSLSPTILRTLIATASMATACYGASYLSLPRGGFLSSLFNALAPFVAGVAAYLIVARLLQAPEISLLMTNTSDESDPAQI